MSSLLRNSLALLPFVAACSPVAVDTDYCQDGQCEQSSDDLQFFESKDLPSFLCTDNFNDSDKEYRIKGTDLESAAHALLAVRSVLGSRVPRLECVEPSDPTIVVKPYETSETFHCHVGRGDDPRTDSQGQVREYQVRAQSIEAATSLMGILLKRSHFGFPLTFASCRTREGTQVVRTDGMKRYQCTNYKRADQIHSEVSRQPLASVDIVTAINHLEALRTVGELGFPIGNIACSEYVPPPCSENLEVCDGKDNNCDGVIDMPECECILNESRSCGLSPEEEVGLCTAGVQHCTSAGTWSECIGLVEAAVEICDGEDNDCDGDTDEGLLQECETACGKGVATCEDGEFINCDAPQPTEEICDGKDNDCNGTIDDGCECLPNDTRSCGDTDVGLCSYGVQTCNQDGTWGECAGVVTPKTEVCDGEDNDCDGTPDEEGVCTPPPAPPSPSPGPTGPSQTQPAQGCASSGGASSGAFGLFVLALIVGGRRRRRVGH